MGKLSTSLDRGFKVHPRGFLGGLQSTTIIKSDTSKPNTRLTVDLSLFSQGRSEKITANLMVDNIFKEIQVHGSGSFERRERFLKAALFAFGSTNFHTWYLAQFQSPSFGDIHQRFLEDTFKFIQTGKRDIPLSSWNILVNPEEDNSSKVVHGDQAKKLFQYSNNNHPDYRPSIVEITQRWLSQEGGFNDFATTVHILFGISEG